eukprot:m.234390 g.234390  ORF g.234390 m.234390 type:complete len:266 (-) comp17087_c1_seq1:655-1452(-)
MRERLEIDYVSWLGDLAYGLGIVAFVMIMVGTCTPAWVDTEVEIAHVTPAGGEAVATHILGRGLFQAYEYDGYGQINILPFYRRDRNGSLFDPFCGSSDVLSSFQLLQQFAGNGTTPNDDDFRGRRYNTHNWCTRRQAAAVFAIFTCLFSFASVIATSCAQKGLCNQTPFIILIVCVFFTGLIACSIIGGFIDLEIRYVNSQELRDRFIPFEQNNVPGYSFIVFTLGVMIYLGCLFLALFEKWCHEGKVEGGTPRLKLAEKDSKA